MSSVNHPGHYNRGNIEAIDAIESAVAGLTPEEAFSIGSAIKYLFRWKEKGGVEDLHKARWYIEHVIDMHTATTTKPMPMPMPQDPIDDNGGIKGVYEKKSPFKLK